MNSEARKPGIRIGTKKAGMQEEFGNQETRNMNQESRKAGRNSETRKPGKDFESAEGERAKQKWRESQSLFSWFPN